jgi:hypothetical protein
MYRNSLLVVSGERSGDRYGTGFRREMDALGDDGVELAVDNPADGDPVGDAVSPTGDTLADDPRVDGRVRNPDLAEGFDEDVGFLTSTEIVLSETPEVAHADSALVINTDPRPIIERMDRDRHDPSSTRRYLSASVRLPLIDPVTDYTGRTDGKRRDDRLTDVPLTGISCW